MMKISVCTKISALPSLAAASLRSVELNLAELMKLGETELSALCTLLKRERFTVVSVNCFFPSDVSICGAEYSLPELLHYTERAAERLYAIGCPLAVLGSGKARRLDPIYGEEKGRAQFETFLQAALAVFSRRGIALTLEPLNAHETNFLNTLDEADALAAVHPGCGVLCDFYHHAAEQQPLSALAAAHERLWHCHIACPGGRSVPLPGDGFEAEYLALFAQLRQQRYTGAVSIEARVKTQDELSQSVEYLRMLAGQ